MHFGVNFQAVLGTAPVCQNVHILGTPALDRVAQHILACSLLARDDSLNVPRLSKLYFLSCMLDGDQLDPGSFLAR